MKNLLGLSLVFAVLMVFVGCGNVDPASSTGEPSTAAIQKTGENAETIDNSQTPPRRLATTTAGKARDMLAERLTARLTEVMQQDGPVAAINVCSQEARQIAQQVGEELGVRIGRTSTRLRNSQNTPPEWATEWIEAGEAEPHAQLLDDGSTAALMPIKLQPHCVMCHGQSQEIPEAVRGALAELYPSDQATGFAPGELRGWFWVEVPAEG